MITHITVSIDSMGICEHCETVLTMAPLTNDALDGTWTCLKCDGVLTHKSFGFEQIEGEWKKMKWIDKDGKWIVPPLSMRSILLLERINSPFMRNPEPEIEPATGLSSRRSRV